MEIFEKRVEKVDSRSLNDNVTRFWVFHRVEAISRNPFRLLYFGVKSSFRTQIGMQMKWDNDYIRSRSDDSMLSVMLIRLVIVLW